MKNIKFFLRFIPVLILYYFFKVLGIDRASNMGGLIACSFGPWLKINAIARRNIERAMPELTPEQVDEIMDKMWDNLGRYAGEFPHMGDLTGEEFASRVEISGKENFDRIKAMGKGGILFSGHFANWEILPKSAYESGVPLVLVYRQTTNPLVNNFVIKARGKSHKSMFNKGAEAARGVVSELKKHGYIGMLVDQKMNEGVKLKFFGRDAMTAPALVQFAMKFDCPMIPVLVRRKKGAYFTAQVFPPLEIMRTGNEEEDAKANMQKVNDLFEAWIREKPEEWFWVHRRWVD